MPHETYASYLPDTTLGPATDHYKLLIFAARIKSDSVRPLILCV